MKFSIRDVLWLTVVVALAVCWGIDRVQLQRAEHRAKLVADRARYAAEVAQANAVLMEATAVAARAAEIIADAKPE